jgi:hypothetical protein
MAEATKGNGWSASTFFVGDKVNGSAAISTFTGTINTGTTFANTPKANPGSLLLDLTGKKLYINTGTKASPTWTVVGSQS